MKDKLVGALGGFGFVLWYIFSIIYAFAPLYILRFPFWIDLILICVITTLPFVGEVVRLGLYVWAFAAVVGQPINVYSIGFYVCAVLYLLTTVIPMLGAMISKK